MKPPAKRRRTAAAPAEITQTRARAIWIAAQRLDQVAPFGAGSQAVTRAVEHLGYIQIDTINVIERCHHHILFNRIPTYQRGDLLDAQSQAKTVFEYWTHALSYVPVRDFRFFVADMKAHRVTPTGWSAGVEPKDISRVLRRVRKDGPLTISDIKDDVLVDKDHPWASRKPSKRALQAGFYNGQLMVARRDGMLKTYELTERHFGWDRLPKPATVNQIHYYRLDRALRAQGIVSLDSICHLNARAKVAIKALVDKEVRARRLIPVTIGKTDTAYWTRPETLERDVHPPALTHILSPFDPLIILRKRTAAFFGYDHLFEAYVPREKRKLGYFTLPVLAGDEIVAALDLKAARQVGKLLIQAWHWIGPGSARTHKATVEEALDRFARFQFPDRT